ncbi:MAG: trimethylamine methyltransferase family protein [Candidatus Omnitrophota bacterium]
MKKTLRMQALLEQGEISRIERLALEVLETYGMKVSNKEALERISSFDEIKIKNNRVYLKADFVKEKVEEYKKDKKCIGFWSRIENVDTDHIMRLPEKGLPYPYRPTFLMCNHASWLLDPATEKVRSLNTNDVIEMTRFMDTLSLETSIKAAAPGDPQDLPPFLQPIARYKISCQYSRHGGLIAPSGDIRASEYIYEMAQVMGKPFITNMYVISPLRMEGNDFDKIMHFIDRKVPIAVSTWPMLGATAPITFPEAVVQSLAEVLGGYTILKLLSNGSLVGFKVRLHAFDMKEASLAYGTPEDCLSEMFIAEINRFYGNAHICQMNTMAKETGVQSGTEKFSSALCGVLSGAMILADIGQVSLDEIFSPEQAIYDCEILENVMRLVEGFEYGEGDIRSCKEAVLGDGSYLSSEETLKNFRKAYWMPKVFSRAMFQQYSGRGENQKKRVKELIKEKIKNHNFILKPEKNRELERIYQKAKEELEN